MDISHFEKIESYLPMNLLSGQGFVLAITVTFLFIVGRYFAFVGIFYWFFWKNRSQRKSGPYLHDQALKEGQIAFELKWSMVSSLVFAFSAYVLGLEWQLGWSKIYLPLDAKGWLYLPVSFLLLALTHEFYFYFTHLLLHRPAIYRRFHAVHHFSRKTSPWASFSFHPVEALIQALFLPIVLLWIPVHPLVLLGYLTFMTLTAISNHLGVEIIRTNFITSWFISGEHHALHHDKFSGNYGLYFCFLDSFFSTDLSCDKKRKFVAEKISKEVS